MRQLLMMHYSVRDKAVVALGEQETMAIMGDIVERLRKRFGDELGTPRPAEPAAASGSVRAVCPGLRPINLPGRHVG